MLFTLLNEYFLCTDLKWMNYHSCFNFLWRIVLHSEYLPIQYFFKKMLGSLNSNLQIGFEIQKYCGAFQLKVLQGFYLLSWVRCWAAEGAFSILGQQLLEVQQKRSLALSPGLWTLLGPPTRTETHCFLVLSLALSGKVPIRLSLVNQPQLSFLPRRKVGC